MEEENRTKPYNIPDPYVPPPNYYQDPITLPAPYEPIPVPPPPPKELKQVHLRTVIALVSLFFLLLATGTTLLIAYVANGGFKHAPGVTPIVVISPTSVPARTSLPTVPSPTPTLYTPPTPTSVPTPMMETGSAPYNADIIMGAFYQAGLTPSDTFKIDANWSCCSYYPAGGAGYWPDIANGENMDMATFASIADEDIDANELGKQGFGVYTVGYCLLSFGTPPPDLSSYLSVMHQVCTG